MALPKMVASRLSSAIRRFQPVLDSARARDINESDTVTIVADMLSELFGYDKYADVTSEHSIRGTYCDLALQLDGKIALLLEVKAIGTDLKAQHMKQAVDYAANQGTEWVVLTNGVRWDVYRVAFKQPIDAELVLSLDMCELSHRNACDLELLYPLTREGVVKSALEDYHEQRQATNRFVLAALILSESVIKTIRRELKRVSPDVKIGLDELGAAITSEVLRREVVESEEGDEHRKRVAKALGRKKPPRRRPVSSADDLTQCTDKDTGEVCTEDPDAADDAEEASGMCDLQPD